LYSASISKTPEALDAGNNQLSFKVFIVLQVSTFGWEINVPFQHKNRLYRRQGLAWRCSSARL